MPTEHRRDNDAPRADRALAKLLKELGQCLLHIDLYVEEVQEERPTVIAVRVKCDPDDEKGVLGIVHGYQGADWVVAFHRDDTFSACITGIGKRLRNGSLNWKEDTYAK